MKLAWLRIFRMPFWAYAFLMTVVVGVTSAILMLHEPDFYRRCAEPSGTHRSDLSNEFFVKHFTPFVANFVDGRGSWSATFTQQHINSFFEEDFVRFGDAEHFAKMGISEPRVEFKDGLIRIGFRYGLGKWSTVMSYDLKVWLVRQEVNVVAVEIQRRRAGAMPIPSQYIFQELKELGRKHNIDVAWYRHEGNPVAIVKFQYDRPRPSAQLRDVNVENGQLTIQGLSFDPATSPIEEPVKKGPVQVSQSR